MDFTVIEAKNGYEALDKVRSETPDLIVSDVNMPELSGVEMLKTLRAEGSPMKVGFLSSNRTEVVQKEVFDLGASFFLVKPLTVEKLKEALAKVA